MPKRIVCCLGRCGGITGGALEAFRGMPLTSLGLEDIRGITGEFLGAISGCPLGYLNLADCVDLEDEGLEALKGLPLTNLNLSGCSNITDFGLEILRGLPLTALNLTAVPVTRGALFRFLNDSPTLQNFEFVGVASVSADDEAEFWKARYLKAVGAI